MEKNLQKLWEILNISVENNLILKDAKLLKIEFKKSNTTTYFFLQIFKVLDIEIIKDIEVKLEHLDLKIKLIFFTLQEQYDLSDILKYWEYIKTIKIKKKEYINSNINNLVLENNVLFINVFNEAQNNLVKQHLNYYQTRLQRYGFNNLILQTKIINIDYNYQKESLIVEDQERKKVQLQENNKSNLINNSNRKKSKISITKNMSVTYKISDLELELRNVVTQGKVFKIDSLKTKTNRWVYSFYITDYLDTLILKYFTADDNKEPILDDIKLEDWIYVKGDIKFDNFVREQVLWINKIKVVNNTYLRLDNAKEKRIELHTHTKMSAMDAVNNVEDYIKQVSLWNHSAIAITDHLNVQSFPDAQLAQKKYPNVKVIYGSEMAMINTNVNAIVNPKPISINNIKYVIFDIETTGLSSQYDEIIEFGAVVINNIKGIPNNEKYSYLIKPSKPINEFTESLTSITNKMLESKPTIFEMAPKFKEIFQDAVIVAHNATFDVGFIQELWYRLGYGKLTNPVIDTLQLARLLKPDLKYYRLGTVARKYNVKYDESTAHRADYDAGVLAQIFNLMLDDLEINYQVKTLTDIASLNYEVTFSKLFSYHVVVLAKNQQGLEQLFNLISLSHTKYFYNSPKIPWEVLDFNRNNIFLGAGCFNSEIFDYAKNKTQLELESVITKYDYIEVQPLDVFQQLLQLKELSLERLKLIIKTIVFTAKKLNKIVVASGDVHYLNFQDKIFRDIYINTKGIGGSFHYLYDRKGLVKEYPNQYLRTTDEMLEAFSFLEDEELIKEIVIKNPNLLNEQIDFLKPIKDELYTPNIENVDEKLKLLCYENAKKIYGEKLPTIVEERLIRELNSIIKHGFSVIYWIAHELVEYSLKDGYLVGSRGSVGSSLVATMANITEVNPLSPHYICKNCKYSEFIASENIKSGYDLSEKKCPSCLEVLFGEGHDIPFETFLGFDGDKVPDIDLNFSGEYQLKAHNLIREMFGEDHVFRAGTISTVAIKTAFGYAKGYLEKIFGEEKIVKKSYLEWLVQGCVGVKRTTGQHPGGIIIVPKEYKVNSFSPVNYPADDQTSSWKTTHFDFHAIHDNLLKLDILGHVDPTALKMLHDLTGYDPKNIVCNDVKVFSLFSSLESLNISSNDINNETLGVMGLPEFGTQFVRKMLEKTKPSTFAELVQISGLSHGTDLWLNNAQFLIEKQGLKLKDVIGCRDDIMVYLLHRRIPADIAFRIMESVRKGKGINEIDEKIMLEHNVPQWYIDSCQKIKYMFPKAHATAYVIMAFRIAWYKIHYPHEYYATYFSTRCDVFDIKTILQGKTAISSKLKDILQRLDQDFNSKSNVVSQREKDLVPVLEVALEMYARNIEFLPLDLYSSDATKFLVVEVDGMKKIIPPFIAVDGLGITVANSIIEARKIKPILSLEDLQRRTSLTKTLIKHFEDLGLLKDLAVSDQLSFNFFAEN